MKIIVGHHYVVQRERLSRQITALECCFCRWRIHRGWIVRFMERSTDRQIYEEMRTRMAAHVRERHTEARAS